MIDVSDGGNINGSRHETSNNNDKKHFYFYILGYDHNYFYKYHEYHQTLYHTL